MSSDPLRDRDWDCDIAVTGTVSTGPSGLRRSRLSRWVLRVIRLPVRNRSGTSRQRSVSTHRRPAMNVWVTSMSSAAPMKT
jgi:hypothetical protein